MSNGIREELTRLAERFGGHLRPSDVVEAARSPESPLHNSFTWDDTKAAELWRIHQARQLICAVVTYEQVSDGRTVPVRAFVSLTPDREKDGAGYRLLASVLSDDERRQQMLSDALADMQRFREKYRSLKELASVFAAIEAVESATPEMVAAR